MPCCPQCRSIDLVRIDLDPGDGLLRFSACRNCLQQWWARPETSTVTTLQDVLQRVEAAQR